MPIKKCKICRNSFYAKPNWIRRGWGIYCSRACLHKGQIRGVYIECSMCGKETFRPQSQIKKSKSRKFFCTKSCQTLWRNKLFSGDRHPNWKGGEYVYRKIMQGLKTRPVCKLCELRDQRILIVHHLDANRKNNNIHNLIWLCHNCHFLVHHHKPEKMKLKKIVG